MRSLLSCLRVPVFGVFVLVNTTLVTVLALCLLLGGAGRSADEHAPAGASQPPAAATAEQVVTAMQQQVLDLAGSPAQTAAAAMRLHALAADVSALTPRMPALARAHLSAGAEQLQVAATQAGGHPDPAHARALRAAARSLIDDLLTAAG